MARMTPAETIAEIEWLRDGQVSPALISTVLGRSAVALEGLARRNGRQDVARLFYAELKRP